jgi:hypothetical protein
MTRLSEKAERFLAKKPEYIGTIRGYRFYEHPTLGDESPLIVITPGGKLRKSDFWELPDGLDICDI